MAESEALPGPRVSLVLAHEALLTPSISRCCTYGILNALYGLGFPDSHLEPNLPAYMFRSLQYNVWWELSYLISSTLIKTSIGVAVIRIALKRRYRYTTYVFVIVSCAICVVGVIWELAACAPISSRWNPYDGACKVPGLIQLSYLVTAVTVVTDAGYALVPIFILRRLSMMPRVKYGLMFVLALGSVAAVASVCRYPFIGYFAAEHDYLRKSICLLSCPKSRPGRRDARTSETGQQCSCVDDTIPARVASFMMPSK